MAGKQAKILSESQARSVIRHLRKETRYGERNLVMFLLSYRAGLRAGEIAKLTWQMIWDSDGKLQDHLEVRDSIAKKGNGRIIPMHKELSEALLDLRATPRASRLGRNDAVIQTMRNGPMPPHSVVCWFKRLYATLGLEGASSHSGRRTLATRSARNLSKVGGSLKDLQDILGHKNISTTQIYVDVSSRAKRQLIDSL